MSKYIRSSDDMTDKELMEKCGNLLFLFLQVIENERINIIIGPENSDEETPLKSELEALFMKHGNRLGIGFKAVASG